MLYLKTFGAKGLQKLPLCRKSLAKARTRKSTSDQSIASMLIEWPAKQCVQALHCQLISLCFLEFLLSKSIIFITIVIRRLWAVKPETTGSLLIRIVFYIKSMHRVVYCKVGEFYKAPVRCLNNKETPNARDGVNSQEPDQRRDAGFSFL